jgi:glycosyltransferase involved in cell wall biosynthesis
VRYETEYLSGQELARLQNSCAVHVIPSQAEGYGHIIAEGMSCGAVVVTTDAPPMNELVAAGRGMLVGVAHSEPMRRCRRHFVDLDELEAQLTLPFSMSPAEPEALGCRAREWYEEQAQRFERHMGELLTDVMDARGSRS